jgi:hypothetical protein
MYTNQPGLRDPGNYLKTITIIHIALLTGQVMFAIVSFFMTNSTSLNLNPAGDVYFYIVPVFALFGIIAGSLLFKQLVAGTAGKKTLSEKLAGYQTALIVRFALTEGASLFAIVSYLLGGNLFYLVVAGLNMLYFILIRPTKDKMSDDLNLSYEDKIAMGI